MVKKVFFIFILLFSILAFCVKPYAQSWFTVKWVDDGDTIVLSDGRHIRYIGINSPEIEHKDRKAEPYGYKAKLYNKQLVLLKKVRLQFDKEKYDRYGRTLAYVFLPGGISVNKEMIEKGYAYVLPRRPNTKYNRVLLKAQHNAMLAGKGMWTNWKQKPGKYWGSRKSKRFHYPTCRFAKRIAKKKQNCFFQYVGWVLGRVCTGETMCFGRGGETFFKHRTSNVQHRMMNTKPELLDDILEETEEVIKILLLLSNRLKRNSY